MVGRPSISDTDTRSPAVWPCAWFTKGTVMFERWGRFVYRRRRWIAGLAVLVAAISFGFATRASSVLSTGCWYDPSS